MNNLEEGIESSEIPLAVGDLVVSPTNDEIALYFLNTLSKD